MFWVIVLHPMCLLQVFSSRLCKGDSPYGQQLLQWLSDPQCRLIGGHIETVVPDSPISGLQQRKLFPWQASFQCCFGSHSW